MASPAFGWSTCSVLARFHRKWVNLAATDGPKTGVSTFEHRTSAGKFSGISGRNSWSWQVEPWKVTPQGRDLRCKHVYQHGLRCWSELGRSFLRWGERSTHKNGRFASRLFHLHKSCTTFYLPHFVQWCRFWITHSVVLQDIHLFIHFHFQKISIFPCWNMLNVQPRKVKFIDLFSIHPFKVTIPTIRELVGKSTESRWGRCLILSHTSWRNMNALALELNFSSTFNPREFDSHPIIHPRMISLGTSNIARTYFPCFACQVHLGRCGRGPFWRNFPERHQLSGEEHQDLRHHGRHWGAPNGPQMAGGFLVEDPIQIGWKMNDLGLPPL